MNQYLIILFMVLIGAGIGWITNILAIKLLFRPIEPYRIPILGYKIQGLLPSRKAEVAASIGKTVEYELISIDEISQSLVEGADKQLVLRLVKERLAVIVDHKLPVLVPSGIKSIIVSYINDIIDKEGEGMLKELSDTLIKNVKSRIVVSQIVEDKINSFPFEKLEDIILQIAKKELVHIERLGGILGGFIGLIQGIIMVLIK